MPVLAGFGHGGNAAERLDDPAGRPFLQIHPEDGFEPALGRVGEVVDSADADVGVVGHPKEVGEACAQGGAGVEVLQGILFCAYKFLI